MRSFQSNLVRLQNFAQEQVNYLYLKESQRPASLLIEDESIASSRIGKRICTTQPNFNEENSSETISSSDESNDSVDDDISSQSDENNTEEHHGINTNNELDNPSSSTTIKLKTK